MNVYEVITRRQHARLAVMKVFSAKVQDGVIVDDELRNLPEGSSVLIAVGDAEAWVDLSPEEEAELVAAVDESEQGEGIPLDDVLRRL